jgi:hypothetical protein
MPVRDACKKAGVHLTSYYAWKREAAGLPRRGDANGEIRPRRAKLELINVADDAEETVTFFHGKPSAINQVLSRLKESGA